MTLTDEKRRRIEEEERFRAHARIRAEAEARRKAEAEAAAKAAQEKKKAPHTAAKVCLGFVGVVVLLAVIGSLLPESKDKPRSSEEPKQYSPEVIRRSMTEYTFPQLYRDRPKSKQWAIEWFNDLPQKDQQRFHDIYHECVKQFSDALDRGDSSPKLFEGLCIENATPEQRKLMSEYLRRDRYWYAKEVGF